MILVLSSSVEQEQELQQLLEEQQKNSSANYHRWLSAAEFGARFGAADAGLEKGRAWLGSNGFTVGAVSKSKRWIEFGGTSQQVEDAFHAEMQYYRVAVKTHIANATDIAVGRGQSRKAWGLCCSEWQALARVEAKACETFCDAAGW